MFTPRRKLIAPNRTQSIDLSKLEDTKCLNSAVLLNEAKNVSFSDQTPREIRRCLKAWPHASHIVAALQSRRHVNADLPAQVAPNNISDCQGLASTRHPEVVPQFLSLTSWIFFWISGGHSCWCESSFHPCLPQFLLSFSRQFLRSLWFSLLQSRPPL